MTPPRSYTDLAPLPSWLYPPHSCSHRPPVLPVLHCRWIFINHLAWKGNKRPTHERSHVILFSRPLPFVFYFCLHRQTLSGSRERDKPSMALCGETIWLIEKRKKPVVWCCFSPPTFSSSLEASGSSQWCGGLSETIYQVTPSAQCQPFTSHTRRDAKDLTMELILLYN